MKAEPETRLEKGIDVKVETACIIHLVFASIN